jgi:hypothetical protein
MQELLQRIDPDYYRTALLLIVRTEVKRLRKGRSRVVAAKELAKITHGTPCTADNKIQSLVLTAAAEYSSLDIDVTD